MKPEFKIDVSLNITDETAVLCVGLLDMFCSMKRRNYEIGYAGCKGCALVRDSGDSGYCNYRHCRAWYKEDVKND